MSQGGGDTNVNDCFTYTFKKLRDDDRLWRITFTTYRKQQEEALPRQSEYERVRIPRFRLIARGFGPLENALTSLIARFNGSFFPSDIDAFFRHHPLEGMDLLEAYKGDVAPDVDYDEFIRQLWKDPKSFGNWFEQKCEKIRKKEREEYEKTLREKEKEANTVAEQSRTPKTGIPEEPRTPKKKSTSQTA